MMETIQVKEETTKDLKQHDLVRGDFTPEEAREIINHLISKKINFHELRNFSQKIRFGESEQHSLMRIAELKDSQQSINELLRDAEGQGKSVRVVSNISIELI